MQGISCHQPFRYSVLLFSVSSSLTWSLGINLDVVHGAPKRCVAPSSQCLSGKNENKIQLADVGSKRNARNIITAMSVQRVKALGKMVYLISQLHADMDVTS